MNLGKLLKSLVNWLNSFLAGKNIDEDVEATINELFERLSESMTLPQVVREIADTVDLDYDTIVAVLMKYLTKVADELDN